MAREKKPKMNRRYDKKELSSQIRLHIDEESRSLFQNDVRRRKTMTHGGRRVFILAIITFVLWLWAMTFGNVASINGYMVVGPFMVNQASFLDYLALWRSVIESFPQMDATTLSVIRGYVVLLLIGMAMACSGAVYQGVLRNPMASPTTLGVMSGGLAGGIVYILFFYNETTWKLAGTANEILEAYEKLSIFDKYGMQICTMLGCFIGVAIILGVSTAAGRGKINTVTLMLTGSIFSTVINEISQVVQYAILYNAGDYKGNARLTLLAALQGSSSSVGNSVTLETFLFVSIPVVLCLIFCFSMTGRLNILMFGEEEARTMGVPVQLFRILLIICCTLMTAVVMSFAGQVAMLGFIMPHLARFLVGPDFKYLVPASALLGGIGCLIVACVCSATLTYGYFNTYVSVFCTIASVFFILLYRRNRHADWA